MDPLTVTAAPRPLLLVGGPAAGKSATAPAVARSRIRAAVIDVDDVRQLVVSGHCAPWEGERGRLQQEIGIANACDMARRFGRAGVEAVLCDVPTAAAIKRYRQLLPEVLIVQLQLPLAEARRRATLRPVHLSDEEFDGLHGQQVGLPVDRRLDVTSLTLEQQALAVLELWQPQPGEADIR